MVQKSGLMRKELPQVMGVEVLVQGYKEPILAVNHGGYGWYGLMAYSDDGEEKVMCHECGKFFNSLGHHVVKKHRFTPEAYREKYGLLGKAKLTSKREALRCREAMLRNREGPVYRAKVSEAAKRGRVKAFATRDFRLNGHYTLQFQNQMDTCSGQLLRGLIDASKVYGDNVSLPQVEKFRSSLPGLLKRRFGSFNKAKQLANLMVNKSDSNPIPEQLLLEDMVLFYRKNNCWPRTSDYRNGRMIYSTEPICRNGGILFLREKAIKLYEEQESRAMVHETVSKIAERINFENAAYARR